MSGFPPPPSFFKLYGGGGGESAPPAPPEPIEGTYEMFGTLYTSEDGVAPLAAKQLYEQDGDGIDFKGELLKLNREAVFNFISMVDQLVEGPSSAQQMVDNLHEIFCNMHHLLNLMRPHQARATLEHMLRTQIERKRAAAGRIKEESTAAEQNLVDAAIELGLVNDREGWQAALAGMRAGGEGGKF